MRITKLSRDAAHLSMVFLIVILVPTAAYSDTLFVPNGYSTIQKGIDAAAHGDTVLVLPGKYLENINFKGKAITVRSSNGPEVTIMDGSGQTLSVVRFRNNEGFDSVLEGFTLTNGSGVLEPALQELVGGGIYCENTTPTIKNNLIKKNIASSGGGIACVGNASPVIEGNIIRENTVLKAGGGLFCCSGSSPVVTGNIISFNLAQNSNGGGIFCIDHCLPTCLNCQVSNNSAGHVGGGISIRDYCDATLINCMIYGNASDDSGGGIRVGANSNATVTNCTFFGNFALEGGGAFSTGSNTVGPVNEVSMTNCILWGDTAFYGSEIALNGQYPAILMISHSDVEGGRSAVFVKSGFTLDWGEGMIDTDPLFTDPMNGDFHLNYQSPCRGSGNNTVPDLSNTDFEGDPRIAHDLVDMGADEFYTHLSWAGVAEPGGNIEIKFFGLPETTPVALMVGNGVLKNPVTTQWGEWWNEWWLKFPIIGPLNMGSIPSPDGVYVIHAVFPPDIPGPYAIPMQAFIGDSLTNVCVMEVE